MPRINLDNAATSWPKPESVYKAVDQFQREKGAPAGRSAYSSASDSERIVTQARRRAAAFLGIRDYRRLIFSANGTDSLNLALHGLLQDGDHVITSTLEHNSVLRPLRHLEAEGVQVSRVQGNQRGIISPRSIQEAIQPNTRLIALIHASNVTGALQPIEEIASIAKKSAVPLLVDAAQSLGQIPIDVEKMGIDLLAAPGHKGMLAPLGTGLLYIAEGLEASLKTYRQGGTGSASEEDWQPNSLPDKYEAGNPNVPALAGLEAGAAWLAEQGIEKIRAHHQGLTAQLLEGLAPIKGIEIYGPRDAEQQVGLVSFNLAEYAPQELAAMLDSAFQIEARSGLHCAPLIHKEIGSQKKGGTVRISFGPFNTEEQVDTAIQGIVEIQEAGGAINASH